MVEAKCRTCAVRVTTVCVCINVKCYVNFHFSCIVSLYVSVVLCLPLTGRGFAFGRDFLALILIRSRKLKFSTNVHTKHVTPPDAKPLLAAAVLVVCYVFRCHCRSVFGLSYRLCVCGFKNFRREGNFKK